MQTKFNQVNFLSILYFPLQLNAQQRLGMEKGKG